MKSKEEIAKKYFPCTCGEIYLSRNLTAPDCPFHAFDWDGAFEEYAQQSQPSGMRWVRASERLPEDGVGMLKYVWVRNIQTKAGCMQPLADYKKIDGIENTEWLDEPSPAGAAEGANDVDYLG